MVDLDRGHEGAGSVERERQRSKAGSDLENLVARTYRREACDPLGEIRVHHEVLTKRLRRSHARRAEQIHRLAPPEPTRFPHDGIWKTRAVFSRVSAANVAIGVPRTAATASPTTATHAGSFRCPRCGTGAKYGASVSTRIRSSGTKRAASRSAPAFLNVTMPLTEM